MQMGAVLGNMLGLWSCKFTQPLKGALLEWSAATRLGDMQNTQNLQEECQSSKACNLPQAAFGKAVLL